MCAFKVSSIKQIVDVIIPHMDKYPLVTQKRADYNIWKDIIAVVVKNKPLSEVDLQSIVNFRASLNLGLSEVLEAAFPNTKPVTKPVISEQVIPHFE